MTMNDYRELMISILEMKARDIDLDEYWDYYSGIMEAVETLRKSAFLTEGK